ncbi:MAG: stress-induced morphogen [Psychromonas sp.]|jgi:stress-induced morphogen|uniref:BolA family protein n=1 Tax=Psychromonas sp. TaxID=1884585 RepID=UPI0039E3C01C
MNVQTIMEKKIEQGIAFEFFKIENESYRHAVPVNSETHFKVILVSEIFAEMPLLARHRLVNELLSEELAGPVHALALHTYTGAQWLEKNKLAPDSGNCLGGGK